MGKILPLSVKTFVITGTTYSIHYTPEQKATVLRAGMQNNPLYVGAYMGNLPLVHAALADLTVDLNAQDRDHNTPLQRALLEGNIEIVQAILEYKSSDKKRQVAWAHQNAEGNTALHLALKRCGLQIAQQLVQKNKSVLKIKNLEMFTPLELAMSKSTEDVACYLWKQTDREAHIPAFSYTAKCIEKKFMMLFELIIKEKPLEVVGIFTGNKTLLHVAVDVLNLEAFEFFETGLQVLEKQGKLQFPAWVNMQDVRNGNSAFHQALIDGSENMARTMLEKYGARGLSVDLKNNNGETAVHAAARVERNMDVFLKTVEFSKDLNAVDNKNKTPLAYAIERAEFSKAYFLLSRGAKVLDYNDYAAYAALLDGKKNIARVGFLRTLAQHYAQGWESSALSENAKERFFEACDKSDFDALENCRGTDFLHLKNKKGMTALHLAINKSDLVLVQWLLKNGAPVNAPTEQGFTPVYLSGLRLAIALKKNNEQEIQNALAIFKRVLQVPGVVLCTGNGFLKSLPKEHPVTMAVEQLMVAAVICPLTPTGAETGTAAKLVTVMGFSAEFRFFRNQSPGVVIAEAKKVLGVNAHYMQGYTTLLHYSVLYDDIPLARALLEDPETDVNLKCAHGYTALHYAISSGKSAFVKLLLDHKDIRVDIKNDLGEYALHAIAQNKNPLDFAVFQRVFDLFPGALHDKSDYDITPLGLLLRSKNIENVSLDWIENIALDKACVKRELPAQCLVEYGVNNEKIRSYIINNALLYSEDAETSALHVAVKKNDVVSLIEFLERKDVDVNWRDKNGDTMLHLACELGHQEIIDLLLGQPGVVANIPNKKNTYPLHYAADLPFDLMQRVFRLYPDAATIEDEAKASPLGYVFSQTNPELTSETRENQIKFYLKEGVDFKKPCNKDASPLMMAIVCKVSAELFSQLVPVSDVNHVVKEAVALHFAVGANNLEMVRALLKVEALAVNFPDNAGDTALHIALASGFCEVARILLEDPRVRCDLKNNKNQYPLHQAVLNGAALVETVFMRCPEAVNSADEKEITPLGYAFVNAAKDKASLCFLLNQVIVNFNQPCLVGRYPIHEVVRNSTLSLSIVRNVINRSDIQVKSKEGVAAVQYAEIYGNINAMRCLTQARQQVVVQDLKENELKNLTVQDRERYAMLYHDGSDSRVLFIEDFLEQYEWPGIDSFSKEKVSELEVLVEHMKEKYPNANQNTDDYLKTLLHRVVQQEDVEALQYLSAFVLPVNQRDVKGRTPLHYAAMTASPEVLRVLLSRKFVNTVLLDHDNKTPLDLVPLEHENHQKCVELLECFSLGIVEERAITNLERRIMQHDGTQENRALLLQDLEKVGFNAYISEGAGTAYHVAIAYKKYDILEALLARKESSPELTDGCRHTPLTLAIENADHQSVALLVKSGRVSLTKSEEMDGLLPLQIAIKHFEGAGQFTYEGTQSKNKDLSLLTVKALVEGKADPYVQGKNGECPFYDALRFPEIVKLFMTLDISKAKFLDVAKSKHFLHRAAALGNVEVLRLLLDVPELLDSLKDKDNRGNTPAHYAILNAIILSGDPAELALLWEKGKDFIDLDATNADGESVRDFFMQFDSAETVELWKTMLADLQLKQQSQVSREKQPIVLTVKQKVDALMRVLKEDATPEALDKVCDEYDIKVDKLRQYSKNIFDAILKIQNPDCFKRACEKFGLSTYVQAAWKEALKNSDLPLALKLYPLIDTDKANNTALHQTVQIGSVASVQQLLQTGTQTRALTAKNQQEQTPAIIALSMGQHEVLWLLLENAAQNSVPFLEVAPLTPETLKMAISQGSGVLVEKWFAIKSKKGKTQGIFKETIDKDNNTPLHLACLQKKPEIISVLLKESTHLDLHKPNKAGQTVMMLLKDIPECSVPEALKEPPFETLSFEAKMSKIETAVSALNSEAALEAIKVMLTVVKQDKKWKKQNPSILEAALKIASVEWFKQAVTQFELKNCILERWNKALVDREAGVVQYLTPFVGVDKKTKNTPLHQVVELGNTPLIAAVLKGTVDNLAQSLKAQNAQKETALACAFRRKEVSNLVLLLQAAEQSEILETCRGLLEQADADGNTVLHQVCLATQLSEEEKTKLISGLLQYTTYEALMRVNQSGQSVFQLLQELNVMHILPSNWHERYQQVTQVPPVVDAPVIDLSVAVPVLKTKEDVFFRLLSSDDFAVFVGWLKTLDHTEAATLPVHHLLNKPCNWITQWVAQGLPTAARDANGDTVFLAALRYNLKEHATELVKARDLDVNYAPSNGEAPVFLAIKKHFADILNTLLVKGANPECVSSEGKNLLEMAIDYKMQIPLPLEDVIIDQVPSGILNKWKTVLRVVKEWRKKFNFASFVKLINKHGVDVNTKDEATQNTPLHYTFLPGSRNLSMALQLLNCQAIQVNEHNHQGNTPGTLFLLHSSRAERDQGYFPVYDQLCAKGGEVKMVPPQLVFAPPLSPIL